MRQPVSAWVPNRTINNTIFKKWAAFSVLVCLQTVSSVAYKLSQTSSRYAYSTYSALAVSEGIKLAISVALYMTFKRSKSGHLPVQSEGAVRSLGAWNTLEILALSAAYTANNHIVFNAYLRADAASVVMFKSTSSFVIAMLRSCLFRAELTDSKWMAIVVQVCGLVVTQYNACTASAILPPSVYAVLCTSILISGITSVWNERQLKKIPVSLPAQNIVMYIGGVTLNVLGHCVAKRSRPDIPAFFDGYSSAAAGVVLVNACTGIAITAVYKYADAVVKSMALSVATVMVTLLSWARFGLQLNPVNASGCISIAVAVYLYSK